MTTTECTFERPKNLGALKKLLASTKPTEGRLDVIVDSVNSAGREAVPKLAVTVTPDRDLEITVYSGFVRFEVAGTGTVRINCLSNFGNSVTVEGDVTAQVYVEQGVKFTGVVGEQSEMVLVGAAQSRVRTWQVGANGKYAGGGNVRDERS